MRKFLLVQANNGFSPAWVLSEEELYDFFECKLKETLQTGIRQIITEGGNFTLTTESGVEYIISQPGLVGFRFLGETPCTLES